MRIGIDIDGVLTDVESYTAANFTKYCFENNIDYSFKESSYEIEKAFGVSKEIANSFWDEHIFPYSENAKPREFASDIIKKLKQDGHEIYIITARWLTNKNTPDGERMRQIVINWLKENNISYDK